MLVATTEELFDDVIENAKLNAAEGHLVEPRCYQKRVCCKTVDAFNDGVNSILINSATGSGKTFMSLATAKMLQMMDDSIGVGFVVMRSNLALQAEAENINKGINVDGLLGFSMFGNDVPTVDRSGRQIKLLICDESHHDATTTMATVHERIKAPMVLGLSATPFRTDKLKLAFQKTVTDAGIKHLMELGYLASYHKYTIPHWTPEEVCRVYLSDPDRWGKSAMYWRTTDELFECYDRLMAAGVKVGMVTGNVCKIGDDEVSKSDALDALDAGDIRVMTNMYVLTEGWDCPSLETAWVRDSSKLPTTQMAGRVFRKCDGITKKVVQSAGTKYPVERIASPEAGFVLRDDRWVTIGRSDAVERATKHVYRMMANMPAVEMPKIITKNQRNRRSFNNGGLGLGSIYDHD